jgi:hypothetical protein
MADSRKKVQLLRTTKGKMQVEQQVSKNAPQIVARVPNAGDDVVMQRDEQEDREEDEELDALSTTDELEVDTT